MWAVARGPGGAAHELWGHPAARGTTAGGQHRMSETASIYPIVWCRCKDPARPLRHDLMRDACAGCGHTVRAWVPGTEGWSSCDGTREGHSTREGTAAAVPR